MKTLTMLVLLAIVCSAGVATAGQNGTDLYLIITDADGPMIMDHAYVEYKYNYVQLMAIFGGYPLRRSGDFCDVWYKNGLYWVVYYDYDGGNYWSEVILAMPNRNF